MNISPYILLALTSFFWSLNFIIGKVVSDVIPPITVSFLRWLLPLALYLPLSWREIKANKRIYIAQWPTILFLGATGYCLNSIGVYEAVRYTSVINTSFINAFQPALIAFSGYIWYREKLAGLQGVGFVVSLIGVLYIVCQGKLELIMRLKVNPGDLFILASMIFWSIHTILYKSKASEFPATPMFTLMMLGGLLLTLPLALMENGVSDWSWIGRIGAVQVLGILSLNIFPSVMAYQFWNSALKKISPNKVGMFLYLIPIYTTVISVLFFAEKLRPYHVIGGVLIFFGLLMVTNASLFIKGRIRESQ